MGSKKYLFPVLKNVSKSKSLMDTILKKRHDILNNAAKSFYYIDNEQIKEIYYSVSNGFHPSKVERKESNNRSGTLSANIKLISPTIQAGNSSFISETYESEWNPIIMYNILEKYLLENNMVILGLEDYIESKSISDELKVNRELVLTKHKIALPGELNSSFIDIEKKLFAAIKKAEIQESSGFVAVKAEFEVGERNNSEMELRYRHPLNNDVSSDPETTLCVICRSSCFTQSGKELLNPGISIKVVCFGKIVTWNNNHQCLWINPIAIY